MIVHTHTHTVQTTIVLTSVVYRIQPLLSPVKEYNLSMTKTLKICISMSHVLTGFRALSISF